jgi:hypothetical protein
MAKYKLLVKEGYPYDYWIEGKVYDGSFKGCNSKLSVRELSEQFPHDWQKVSGYKLIKEYPGSLPLGEFYTGDMSGYPEFWKPVYGDRFEVGEWVYFDYNGSSGIIRFKSTAEDTIPTDEYYQIYNSDNSLIGEGASENCIPVYHVTKATPEQIERILTKVAISKGYIPIEESFEINNYYSETDRFYFHGTCIYSKGQWVEIIPKP